MKIGSTDIVDCKIGNTQVNKVYLGSNLVWEKLGATLLLDLYPNAAAAYSLRKLRTAYTGSAIEARRSDNAVQNIGFVGNELDTASLLSFANGGDVFVAKWYDQSGAGNDVAQISQSAQPQIVSSGVVINENGKPSVDFDGTNDYLKTNIFTKIPTPTSYFGVFKFDESKNQNIFDGTSTGRQAIGETGTEYKLIGNSGTQITGGTPNTNQNVFNGFYNATNSLFINNISVVTGSVTSDGIDKIVMASNFLENGAYLNGKIQEFILYPSDQLANRTGISQNIGNFYGITLS